MAKKKEVPKKDVMEKVARMRVEDDPMMKMMKNRETAIKKIVRRRVRAGV